MTTSFTRLMALGAAGAALTLASGAATALSINLPAETAEYRASTLPGYALVQQQCLLCHSAQYVQVQPPTSPRSYWEATVKKMKHPFGAPVAEQDIPAIVDYLTKTYGAERPATTAPAPAAAATTPVAAPALK